MPCIYCRSESGDFTRIEHIIPESLGNSDDVLEPGVVCDACNQYFGVKVEQLALDAMPFAVERITGGVRNKRGKFPSVRLARGVTLEPTGALDTVRLSAGADQVQYDPYTGRPFLKRVVEQATETALARLLVKIGIGLLAKPPTSYDALDQRFDDARTFARTAPIGVEWQFAHGELHDRAKLIRTISQDRVGAPIVTHQLYEWRIIEEEAGDVLLYFQYRGHFFMTYLTRRTLGDFIDRHRDKLPVLLRGRTGGTTR